MLTGHRDDKHRQVWLWEWEVWGWILFSFGSDLEGEGTSKSLQNDIWNLPLVGVRQARALEKTGKAKGASYCPRYTGSLENSTIVGPALGLDEHFLKPEGGRDIIALLGERAPGLVGRILLWTLTK